jgi:ketosteroid isomerase-like protein
MSSDNVELMRGTYEAFGRGDIAAVIGVMDENISFNVPAVLPQAMPVDGRGDVGGFFEKLGATWQDFDLQIDDFCASGDRVCVIGRAGGKLDGVAARYGFVHSWIIRDGVCVRFDEYVDPSPEIVALAAQSSRS